MIIPFCSLNAAEFKCTSVWGITHIGTELCYVAKFSGEINPGDAERFDKFLESNPVLSILRLSSPGGDIHEAMKIARLIRERLIATDTYASEDDFWGSACDSACVIVAMGGVERKLSYLGIHRPRISEKKEISLDDSYRYYSVISKDLNSFFEEFLLPKSLLDRMMITGPEGVDRLVGFDTVRRVVPKFDPVFQQWLHSRCADAEKYYVCMLKEREKEIFRRAGIDKNAILKK